MAKITKIIAREVLDSRGNPTVEAEVHTKIGITRAIVPSGASTGSHEAYELRDGDKRFHGQGVQKAVKNVKIIEKRLIGMDVLRQRMIDSVMIGLDGSVNKEKLGANAILAVSIAVCKAGALTLDIPIYKYVQRITGRKLVLPMPFYNVINGGKHAGNGLDFQEYMIVPVGAKDFHEALRIGSEVYHSLKKLIKERYGPDSINVGDEGGFAPPLKNNEEPLKILMYVIEKSGYKGKVKIAVDCASSEFYFNKYLLGNKNLGEKEKSQDALTQGIDGKKLAKVYSEYISKYDIVSIEDPFFEDDWESWKDFTKKESIQIVGDDLLVTNTERIRKAVDNMACNALLLKLNQIGTVTEAIDAAMLSFKNDWNVMVSHRSGDTEDTFIADFAVGLGCGEIKSGAPCRAERTCKYNQLLRIEEELGKGIKYGLRL